MFRITKNSEFDPWPVSVQEMVQNLINSFFPSRFFFFPIKMEYLLLDFTHRNLTSSDHKKWNNLQPSPLSPHPQSLLYFLSKKYFCHGILLCRNGRNSHPFSKKLSFSLPTSPNPDYLIPFTKTPISLHQSAHSRHTLIALFSPSVIGTPSIRLIHRNANYRVLKIPLDGMHSD